DRGYALVRFYHIAIAADEVGAFGVGDQQQRFEVAQHAVGAPLLCQFHHRSREIAVELLEFLFESCKERKSVGGRSRETCENFVAVKTPELSGRALKHHVAQRDLPVARHHDLCLATPPDDRTRSYLLF